MFNSLGLLSSETNPDILISNTLFDFKKTNIKELNKTTKLIIHPNSGYDNFPVDFVEESQFPIIVGNPIRAHAVAQYSFSALLQRYQNIQKHSEWQSGRNWPRPLLSSLNILIIGKGHIGSILEKMCSAFEANPDFLDPDKNLHITDKVYDVIILATSLNKTSKGLVNQKFLDKHLKSDGTIINGARGKLIDSNSLINFLGTNPNSWAFLDVFEIEPEGISSFSKLSNVTTTSHIAGVSIDLDDKMIGFEKEILSSFLNGDNLEEKYPSLLLKNRLRQGESGSFLI